MIELERGEINLLIDVCKYTIDQLKKKVELFEDRKMESNLYLIDLIEDIAAVMDKIDII